MTERKPGGRRQAIHWALAGYWLALVIGTHMPHPETVMPARISDKLLHCGAYVGLTILARWSGFFGLLTTTGRSAAVWTAALLAGYGVIEEVTQIPFGRSAQLSDYLADLTGVMLGLAVWSRWGHRLLQLTSTAENRTATETHGSEMAEDS